jgi:Ni/Fe-hydrogenase subunit HybB-like protein
MKIELRPLQGTSRGYYLLMGGMALVALVGLAAVWFMEHNGHIVTGMNNQIVWGLPHVFAVFLVVAASGALNVASMASVFGKTDYKPLAPLSGLLAIALLLGGLTVLMLDLGRPDRLIVAICHRLPVDHDGAPDEPLHARGGPVRLRLAHGTDHRNRFHFWFPGGQASI